MLRWTVLLLMLVPLAAQEAALPRDEIRTFKQARREAAGPARLRALEALAEREDPRLIPLFLDALEDDAREIGATEKRIETTSDLVELRTRELEKQQGRSAPGALERAERLLKEARGALAFRQEQITELDREAGLLRKALARAIQRAAEPELTEHVRLLLDHLREAPDHHVRRQLLLAVAELPRTDVLEVVQAIATSHKDPRSRADAAEALGILGMIEGEAALIACLDDSYEVVRLAAVRSLRRTGGAGAVEALIDLIESAKGRLLEDVLIVLRHLTGAMYHDNVALWRSFWEKEQRHYRPPGPEGRKVARKVGEEGEAGGSTYYGLRVRSDAVVFLIDVSGSMAEKAGAAGTTGSGPRDETKLERAQREVIRTVQGLPTGIHINLVAYNDSLNPFASHMVVLTEPTRAAIVAWVKSLRAKGETNIFDALELVLNEARGKGQRLSKEMVVDTIFLMTDGLPTAGKITDEALLASEVSRLNSLTRIVIHTIGIGTGHARSLLERLSRDSQGVYVPAR